MQYSIVTAAETLGLKYCSSMSHGNHRPLLLVGVQTGTATLDISRAILQKMRKEPTSGPSNTTFGYIPKGCSVVPQEHVLNYVHNNFIYNSQNLEIT